ncbi:hypothetical protein ACM66B_007037 [Microbotryomycetes sp. NB124-2]
MAALPPAAKPDARSSNVVKLVFLALLLDLLAFTMPLPLFPRLIDSFVQQEQSLKTGSSQTLLSRTLDVVERARQSLFDHSAIPVSAQANHRWNLTLLGGALGVLFSACQALSSPHIGKLADKYGRRRILLLSMIGNVTSALLWLVSGNFSLYALSRLVGGLSEGNVQLSIAIITDVTRPEHRARSLALVGAAFSVAFVFGPPLGAYFAAKTFGTGRRLQVFGQEIKLNVYAVPAAVTLALLVVETLLLAFRLPETKSWKQDRDVEESKEAQTAVQQRLTEEQVNIRLARLGRVHFAFLLLFSGAEFTLTFLTFTLFNFSNSQNGRLLGYIGLVSSLLQGGYVRRHPTTSDPLRGPTKLVSTGIWSSAIALLLLSTLPVLADRASSSSNSPKLILYLAATLLAYTSATVVNSLTSLASLTIDSITSANVDKASRLGIFRSRGQIGRAIGPLLATGLFWIWGPGTSYAVAGFGTLLLALGFNKFVRDIEGQGKVKSA